MNERKILKAHERQLWFARAIAKVGSSSPLGQLLTLSAYFTDLPLLIQNWRDYLYQRKEHISDKFLGLDRAIIYTSYAGVKKLVETVPQKRGNYLGPLRIDARSYFLGNPLSLGTNGEKHDGIRALILQALPDPSQTTEILAHLVDLALARAVGWGKLHVKDDIPKLMVALLHELIFEIKLSEEEINASVAYIDNLGLATVPNPIHTTVLNSQTRSHIQHRKNLIATYKKSPRYQEYLTIGANYQLSEQEVLNNIFDTIHIAGTAGTSALLGSVFGVLCLDEQLKANVISELDLVWDGNETPNTRSVDELKITEKIILETARLYPPVRFVSQFSQSPQEIEFAGKKCPFQTGTRLVASIFTANRDSQKYKNPDDFDIERDYSDILSWNGENIERKCPGQSLSIALIKLFCLYAFKKYQWNCSSEVEWDMKRFGAFTPENLVLDNFSQK
ncbi:cytochrome P450 [Mastigocoleus testarum]|uniref:Cytochrome n=1 Tax=Mastigocoleus testarum BC008 TaxID=371196 RepID=A0A0V7ZC27_9CYAN|nr:cytochrome P450 [Mastigocoleus testarum]KST62073.1 cytochrome [Mastigocoleus testarum BC008]